MCEFLTYGNTCEDMSIDEYVPCLGAECPHWIKNPEIQGEEDQQGEQ